MSTIYHHKLVRNTIPSMIMKDGKTITLRHLNDEEYLKALHDKLDEEVAEFHRSGDLDELADIMEVINALAGAIDDVAINVVEQRRIAKRTERGGFDMRYYLEEVIDPNDTWDPLKKDIHIKSHDTCETCEYNVPNHCCNQDYDRPCKSCPMYMSDPVNGTKCKCNTIKYGEHCPYYVERRTK